MPPTMATPRGARDSPPAPSPKAIGAYKLLSVAGAYWKGDASRPQLQRLYATAFFDKKDLAEHLQRIEESRDRCRTGQHYTIFILQKIT